MRARSLLLVPTLVALGAGACSENDAGTSDAASIEVTSDDDSCELSATSAPSGNIVFEVTNTGSQVTEFYLYEADGEEIVGEVENIGPGLTRNLSVEAGPGSYVTACKPGMTGDGIRGDFTVTG